MSPERKAVVEHVPVRSKPESVMPKIWRALLVTITVLATGFGAVACSTHHHHHKKTFHPAGY
jgi:hypothetical protein